MFLHVGIARGHRGNPKAGLHIHQLYGTPVLMSGLASLVLSPSETQIIEQHFKETLQRLQRLYPRTPRAVIYFLSGSLPGIAHLHLRKLTLFGMITRLPGSVLHKRALNVLCSVPSRSKSWFHQIRDICLTYNLPHPLEFLSSPPTKLQFKKLIKSHVIDYWEKLLRAEAAPLSSLEFFSPAFMSLKSPHPIWTTAGSSPSKVALATIQAQMLSGRYRTQLLCSHWSPLSSQCCQLSQACSNIVEDIPHILRDCEALRATRELSNSMEKTRHRIALGNRQ